MILLYSRNPLVLQGLNKGAEFPPLMGDGLRDTIGFPEADQTRSFVLVYFHERLCCTDHWHRHKRNHEQAGGGR